MCFGNVTWPVGYLRPRVKARDIHSFVLKRFAEPQPCAALAGQGYKNDTRMVTAPLQLTGCSETLLPVDKGRRV